MGWFSRRRERPKPSNPPPSPVPWIADEVWQAWNAGGVADASDCPIHEPTVMTVSDHDRRRAPALPRGLDEPVPPQANVDEMVLLLLSTPPSFLGLHDPVWPRCCQRPATLVNSQGRGRVLNAIEARAGSLDRAYIEREIREGWGARTREELTDLLDKGFAVQLREMRRRGAADGVNIFHCRACGKVYVASCHP